MQRVASLYLPEWAIERLRPAGRATPPEPSRTAGAPAELAPIHAAMADEHAQGCSVPRGGGWRPGARWAREDQARRIEALPEHQRPPIRELGRCDVAAENPFKKKRSSGQTQILPEKAGAPFGRRDEVDVQSSPGGGGGSRRLTEGECPKPDRPWRSPSVMLRMPPPPLGEELVPLVTAIRTANRMEIAAACATARALGIRPGMPLTQARVQVAGLDVRPADPEGDRARLERLAVALARRWSPSVAIASDDTLFIDLTGVAHLHGGEAAMARRLVRRLARMGITAQVAVADTPGAAWALSRQGEAVVLCPPGGHRAALAPLPIEMLRIDPKHVELLHRLGVTRIGQLIELPRGPLVRRFSMGLVLQLDRALGDIAEPIHPIKPPEPIACAQRFAEPIGTAEAIEHWLGVLVPRLAAALEAQGLGASRMELVADRIDGVPQRIRIGLARPSRDGAHLLRLLVRRIGDVEPGYGVDALTLHVRRALPLAPQPVTERLDEEAAPDLAPLVDTLATRIGAKAMWRMRPVESDVPERSVVPMPLLDAPERAGPRARADDVGQLQRNPALHPWHPEWPKPARLLARPERLDHVMAELPDHAPRRFTWRGQPHRVVHADGPERVHGEWWRTVGERDAVRDYFRVEDEAGRRYWLFRRGDGERPETGDLSWYLHGCFG